MRWKGRGREKVDDDAAGYKSCQTLMACERRFTKSLRVTLTLTLTALELL